MFDQEATEYLKDDCKHAKHYVHWGKKKGSTIEHRQRQ